MRRAELEYTRHAKDRMRQRGITEDEVEYCLDHCEVCYADSKGNKIHRASVPGGKRIKVVTAANTDDPLVVITVADLPLEEELNEG